MAIRTLAGGLVAATVAVAATVGVASPAAARPARASAETATYIVTLESEVVAAADVASTANDQLGQIDRRATRVFRSAMRGYTARLTAAEASELRADPAVRAVEPDAVVTVATPTTPTTPTTPMAPDARTQSDGTTQPDAPWGLDRIDQRALPLSTTYTYTNTGAGVTAYVIDTGIRLSHQDFGGRAASGFDAVDGGSADDCNGHGTHVSSSLGGDTYGVAKGTELVAVRVLDCFGDGTLSGAIAGVDWVVADHEPGQPAVANMSLGGPGSTALDTAVGSLIADGVTVVGAAGNSSADACTSSPARVPAVVTVAASSSSDAFGPFSNWGPCVDVIAPGVTITGAWHTGDDATNEISGTSMASPHAAGAAAKVVQAYPGAGPDVVADAVLGVATPDAITDAPGGTPDLLLFSDI